MAPSASSRPGSGLATLGAAFVALAASCLALVGLPVLTAGATPLIPTTLSFASSANPVVRGQLVTYTVTVTPTPDGGTVSLRDGLSPISTCQSVPVIDGTATCAVSYSTLGSHNIYGEYSGTATYAPQVNGGLTPSEIVAKVPCASLAGCNLSGLDLSGANLVFADLSHANLRGANLYEAVMYAVNLSGANLNGANLKNTVGKGGNFDGANLNGADLSFASAYGATFVGANLNHATLVGTGMAAPTDLTGANLNGVNAQGANFGGATTTGANFHNVQWSNTTCADGTNSDGNGGTCIGHM